MTLFITIAVIGAALLSLWWIPELQVRKARKKYPPEELTASDLLKAENDRRSTLAQILGGTAVLAGLYFTAQTFRLQQEGQLTDRINKAVEQLGSDKADVALGGIYQIGRIADDSQRDHWPMLQVLMSYVERHAPLGNRSGQECDPTAPYSPGDTADYNVQAVANVLRRRNVRLESGDQHVTIVHSNLSSINLSGANLRGARFVGDNIYGGILTDTALNDSRLSYSFLAHANVSAANLTGAHLEHVCLVRAQLTTTDFSRSYLENADFRNVVDASGADFTGASLEGTDFRQVDLTHSKGLTPSQLAKAKTDDTTKLPTYLSGPRP
jgi:uncharacterized protein YjbI with pentapeptide repeats